VLLYLSGIALLFVIAGVASIAAGGFSSFWGALMGT
jgi:hypothetical protein